MDLILLIFRIISNYKFLFKLILAVVIIGGFWTVVVGILRPRGPSPNYMYTGAHPNFKVILIVNTK